MKKNKKCDFPDGIDFDKQYVISFLWPDVVKERKKTGVQNYLITINWNKHTLSMVIPTTPKPIEKSKL
jgi:L-rhamnose mutarotase